MTAKIGYGGVDRFRLAAALLVIANHTGPLTSYSFTADFLLAGIVARLSNAFFFMVSGYFLFGKPRGDRQRERAALGRFLSRIGTFYALGMLLYVPLNVYNGYFARGKGLVSYAEDVVFNGTMYHLWYLPAVMLGMCVVYGLRGMLSDRWVLVVSGLLYAAGLLGDSYYGLISRVGAFSSFYDFLFQGFHYTRNGLFFAPLYIALGALAARRPLRPGFVRGYAGAFLISTGLLLAEGAALREAGWPRHDSMYVAMVPTAYALFRLLLAWGGAERRRLRPVCAWMYLLHPLAIVALRGFAEQAGLVQVLIRNSLVYFVSVSALSALLSLTVVYLDGLRRRRRGSESERGRGRAVGAPTRAWAEIDLGNLAHNVREIRRLLPDATRIMAVVKAGAYGHGGVPVARRLEREDVRFFAVAEVDEGIELRRGGVKGDILVLGYTPSGRLADLSRFKLMQTVVSADDAERLQASGHRITVHVKIDTGMKRLGEAHDRMERVLSIYRHSRLRVAGTFSHLAAADGTGPEAIEFTRTQIERFHRSVAGVRAAGFDPGRVHLQSSYGILNHPELRFDLARPGIALYGLLANERDKAAAEKAGFKLRPALALKAMVTRVAAVRAGETVGYGMAYAAARDSVVATISIGYADGIPRELSERGGCVLIRGCRAPIVGRICMDQMMVDATDIAGVRPGDTITLIGADGDDRITAEEVSGWTGTITNETVTALGARVARRYV